MEGQIKRDMSFTSQIQLEMKSNEFWTSPWQQLRLINHSLRKFTRVQFSWIPDSDYMLIVRRSFTTKKWIWLHFVCWLFQASCLLSAMGSSLSGHSWSLLPDTVPPAEPCRKWGKDKDKKISYRKGLLSTSFHLQHRYRKNTEDPNG